MTAIPKELMQFLHFSHMFFFVFFFLLHFPFKSREAKQPKPQKIMYSVFVFGCIDTVLSVKLYEKMSKTRLIVVIKTKTEVFVKPSSFCD